MDKQSKRLMTWQRVLILILILLLLAGAGVGIFLLTRLRMADNAMVCGQDVSAMLVVDVELLLEERVNNYSLNLTVGDQTFSATADDFGMAFLKDTFEDVVKSASDNSNQIDPWAVISLDQTKLLSYFEEHLEQKRTEPVSATVVWDDAEARFKVMEGVPESWLDPQLLADLVKDAVAVLDTELDVPEDSIYVEVHDTARYERAKKLAEKANELIELEQEYIFNPRQVEVGCEVIEKTMIASFLRFDYENDTVFADESAVLAFVESFAPNYTYFKNKDRFITHGGDRVDVPITFQEQTVDSQALASLIVENIASGASGSFEVPYNGYVNFEGDYIEVSIPEQHLWVYQDGVVVLESDVVTGNESRNKRTPRGLNMVRGHLRKIYLMEEFFVEYWMCISMHGQYGFHDADGWREPEEYGGDTYKTNGSGGCVNVPLENMAKMYELVPDYTPVVIYDEHYYD